MNHMEMAKDMNLPEFSEEYMKENVFMVMVNTESNEKLLADIPHRDVNDCSVIYRLMIENEPDGITSTVVTNELAELAGMNEQEIFSVASENTKRILPVKIQSMSEILAGMMTKDGMPEEIAETLMTEIGAIDMPMWVITNENGINGAINMLYDENLQMVAEKLDSDLYILPSSIHEVICVPTRLGEPEELTEMVQEANISCVALEDRLSNQVYHYDKELRKLTMATDTPDKRIDKMVAEQPLIYEAKEQKR